jgi:hypothetical protein
MMETPSGSAATARYPIQPSLYPVWLRMRRTGANLYLYTGAEGTNWLLCGRVAGLPSGFPQAAYVGMATAAYQNSTTQARFNQYGNFVAPAKKQVLLVGLDNSITGSGPADTPARFFRMRQ